MSGIVIEPDAVRLNTPTPNVGVTASRDVIRVG